MIYVFDLDGTLCDDSHRKHFAEKGQWDEYNRLLVKDRPIYATQRLVTTLARNGSTLYVVTARPEAYRVPTIQWLRWHNLLDCFEGIFMRPDDDILPSPEFKVNTFIGKVAPLTGGPIVAFEDRPDVAKALGTVGITTFLIEKGWFNV